MYFFAYVNKYITKLKPIIIKALIIFFIGYTIRILLLVNLDFSVFNDIFHKWSVSYYLGISFVSSIIHSFNWSEIFNTPIKMGVFSGDTDITSNIKEYKPSTLNMNRYGESSTNN